MAGRSKRKNGGDDKMKTALVTDGKYRSSIAAVRALHRAGYRVVVTQTRADVKSAPAVSVSKSCDDFRWIDGACADADYAEKLLSVLKEYEHPVLFCVGAVTLNTVAARREGVCRAGELPHRAEGDARRAQRQGERASARAGAWHSCAARVRRHAGELSRRRQATLRRKSSVSRLPTATP